DVLFVQVANFSTRFSLPSFLKRVNKLTCSQRKAIETTGFGSLLQIPNQVVHKNLLVELMERWNCEKRAFFLRPGEISITLLDVALILGLRVTGDLVILRGDAPFLELEREYGAALWNRKISIASIEERLESLRGADDEVFKRSFLLYTFGTLLFPNSNGKVDSRYLYFLQDMDKVSHFAWGAAVLADVISWLSKRKETNIQYVNFCLIFLQIWSYEHIDMARPSLLDCHFTSARVCRWGKFKSYERQWYTTKFMELESNQILWKLHPTAEESDNSIIRELVEAGSDRIELVEAGSDKELAEAGSDKIILDISSTEVSIDDGGSAKTRPAQMEHWIVHLEKNSEMDKPEEVVGTREDSPMELSPLQNASVVSTVNVDFLATSYFTIEQKERMQHLCISPDTSGALVVTDKDDQADLRTRNWILQEQNMILKEDIDCLANQIKLLKNQLSTRPMLEEQNLELRKEVEILRRQNRLLTTSENSLAARLERVLFDDNMDAPEEQSI
ncbi:hypothetical protein RJ639_007264, partial [Escallonia herrerae]